ncbi:hypothetical protein HanPSC8_Chr17g0766881 [Helianthus annuus]|nr:hypothetical protein HanPSC8_Chr17g0766881 [Helianthus annuus]
MGQNHINRSKRKKLHLFKFSARVWNPSFILSMVRRFIRQEHRCVREPERVQERKVEREKNGRRFLIYEER